MNLKTKLLAACAGLGLAVAVFAGGLAPANAAQGGAISNIGCTTNTYIYITTTTTGPTYHYHAATSAGDDATWFKGDVGTAKTNTSTGTGRSTAYTVSGTGTTLTSISYVCA